MRLYECPRNPDAESPDADVAEGGSYAQQSNGSVVDDGYVVDDQGVEYAVVPEEARALQYA